MKLSEYSNAEVEREYKTRQYFRKEVTQLKSDTDAILSLLGKEYRVKLYKILYENASHSDYFKKALNYYVTTDTSEYDP